MKDTVSQPAGGRGATAPRPADAASPSCGSSPSADSVSVVLAGGGTAGHVEPAMAVADALVALDPRVRITALGTLRGLETRLVPQRGYHLELITAVPMPRKPGGDLARLRRGCGAPSGRPGTCSTMSTPTSSSVSVGTSRYRLT